jgi:cell division FtsZ-interacting protein ZapD
LLYLRRGQRAEWVQDTLTRSVAPLISSLDVMLRLRGGSAPAGKSEIAVAAAQAFGLDGRVLRDLLALKAGTYAPDDAELRRMYGAFMTFVDRVADAVDRL